MTRLRYSLADAKQEAERLATEHVEKQGLWAGARLAHAAPSGHAPRSASSKHPVVWVVSFEFPRPNGLTVDGGELMFDVNIETKEVVRFDVG